MNSEGTAIISHPEHKTKLKSSRTRPVSERCFSGTAACSGKDSWGQIWQNSDGQRSCSPNERHRLLEGRGFGARVPTLSRDPWFAGYWPQRVPSVPVERPPPAGNPCLNCILHHQFTHTLPRPRREISMQPKKASFPLE